MLFYTKIIMTVPATPVDENGFVGHPTNEFSCQTLMGPCGRTLEDEK
jgi:hypothetical protein